MILVQPNITRGGVLKALQRNIKVIIRANTLFSTIIHVHISHIIFLIVVFMSELKSKSPLTLATESQ